MAIGEKSKQYGILEFCAHFTAIIHKMLCLNNLTFIDIEYGHNTSFV